MDNQEKENAKRYGKVFYCRHMIPGLCGYEDETVLISADAMKRMAASFEGKPLYVLHDKRTEAERVATLQETSQGYVTETFYNELDGWLWSKFIAVSDDAFTAIGEGWKVSNAYVPLEYGGGGVHNNIPYDREILNADMTHLALVPDPRYEAACVMTPDEFKMYQEKNREQLNEMRNSKTEKEGFIMKFFKTKKEAVTEIDSDTMVEIKNAKGEVVEMSVAEMVNAVEAKQKKDAEESQNSAKIKVGKTEMTIQELVNAYEKTCATDDKDAEKDNESDEDEDKEKENEGEKDDESKNSKSDNEPDHFKELSNAGQKSGEGKPYRIENNNQKVNRGVTRYGSAQ